MALSAAEKQRRYRERRDADLERRQKYLDLEKAKYRQDLAIGKRKKCTMRRRWRQQKQDLKERKQMLENLVTPPVSPSHPTEPGTSRSKYFCLLSRSPSLLSRYRLCFSAALNAIVVPVNKK
jgi:hypothetical protein